MNFKIKKEYLIKHLNFVIKGISNKNIRPILNCIKFELKQEGLYLSSTDNDIAIRTFITNKEIEEDFTCGKFAVSGKYIYDIIRKLPNEIITIEEVMDSKIYISTANISFSLNFPGRALQSCSFGVDQCTRESNRLCEVFFDGGYGLHPEIQPGGPAGPGDQGNPVHGVPGPSGEGL